MIKAWFSLRLHVQLALASGILLAITISITTWLNIQNQQQALLENTTREAASLAKSISIFSRYLIITNKLDELESLLVQSTTFPFVSEIKVFSSKGTSLSHVKKQASGNFHVEFSLSTTTMPLENTAVRSIINWEKENLVVWQPVRSSSLLGWIKLDVSLSDVVKHQKQSIIDNIVSALVAITLDILTLLAILFIPARSFRKVVSFAKELTKNPGATMAFPGGSFEINHLLQALNASSIELAEQNKKVQQQADRLIELNLKQALLQKEDEQREILNSMLESVFTIDENGSILFFNKAAEILFGYSANEIIGQNIVTLLPNKFKNNQQFQFNHGYPNENEKPEGAVREAEGKRKNNEIFPMQLSISELPDHVKNTNTIRHFIVSCKDITQLRLQEEQLRHTQKMEALGQLTGGVAHDYNNLLGIIHGYAELLKENVVNDSKLTKYVREVIHATDRGTKLTKKLLGFSRKKTPHTTVLNINNLLRNQQFLFEKTLSARIHLTFNLAPNLWVTELDSGDFEDSTINLAINAMHAMKNGGQLILKTQNESLSQSESTPLHLSAGDYISLSVTDSGEGMDQITKEKIFDPFFSTKGEFGSGLGLSQVYGFIERCNGAIKVKSSLGKGSCFTLYFPRSHNALTKFRKTEVRPETNQHSHANLLLVDDEPSLVKLASTILINQGYTVFTALDGYQALQVLDKESIDLMITDVIMPNMDGYELSAKVQQLHPHVKIQIVTGFTDNRHQEMENTTLHQNRLNKPYSSNTLITRVQNLLNDNSSKTANENLIDSGNETDLMKLRVLVMDDEDDVQALFKIALEKLGCHVILTSDGIEAIRQYQLSLTNNNAVDVMIVDLNVPGSIGGKEIAKKIRESDAHTKIIVASGNTECDEMKYYENFGFDAAIQKSFDRNEIKEVLLTVLSNNLNNGDDNKE